MDDVVTSARKEIRVLVSLEVMTGGHLQNTLATLSFGLIAQVVRLLLAPTPSV